MAPNLDISHPLFPSPQQINRTMIDCNSINNNDVDVDVDADYDVVTRRVNTSAVVPSLIYGTPTTTTAVDIAKSHIGMKNKPVSSSVSPKQGPLEKRIRLRRFPERQSLLDVINAEKGQRYLTAAPPLPPLPPPPLMSPPELKRVSANYWLSSPNHQLLFDQHQSFVSYCASEERRWSSKSSTKCPQLTTMDDNDDGNDDNDDNDDLRSPLEYQDTIQQQVMNNDVENEVEIEQETKIGNESRSKRTKSNNNKTTTTMWLMRLVETTNIPIFDLQVQALTSTMKLGLASTVSKVRECRFATEVDHRAKFCLPEYSDEDNNNNEGEVGGDDNNEGQELQQGKGKWWAHNHRNAMGGIQQQQQQQQQQMRPSFHSSSSISVVTPTSPPKNYHRSSLALSPPFMLVDKALAMMTIPVSPILPRKYTFGDNNSTTTAYAKAVNVPRFPSMSEYHHQQEQHCLPGDLLMSRNCHAKGGLSKQTCLFPKVDQVHKHIDGPSPNECQPPPKNYDSSNSVVAAAAAPYNNVASNDDIGRKKSDVSIPSAASRPHNNNSITMTSQQQLCGNG